MGSGYGFGVGISLVWEITEFRWDKARNGATGLVGGNTVDLSLIYRIAGVGILIAILNIFLQQAERKDQAQMLSLAGVIIVLLWLVQLIAQLFEQVESVFRWY